MQRSRPVGSRRGMFVKDTSVPPFFSIHPKTMVGMIIRIALVVFFVLALVFTFLASKGLLFLWFMSHYYLIYVVPVFALFALVIVALFKRMRTTFTKFFVVGMIAMLLFSVLITFTQLLSYQYNFNISLKDKISNKGYNIAFMRTCVDPDDVTEKTVIAEDGSTTTVKEYTVRVPSYRFVPRVPHSVEGESFTIEGEIIVPYSNDNTYEITPEWVDTHTLRLYISKDGSGLGKGEINVKFFEGETAPASEAAQANLVEKRTFTSADGLRDVVLYQEDTFLYEKTDTILQLSEQTLKQVYKAYPVKLGIFASIATRVDGEIVVEPYGTLTGYKLEWIKDDVVRITPHEGSVGVSGEITIYFNEKADTSSENATPAEATPAEAADAKATDTEAE